MPDGDQAVIDELLDRWAAETGFQSSVRRILSHESYARLAAIGMPAADRMLDRMVLGDVHIGWLTLLAEITRENPVPTNGTKGVAAETAAWLAWREQSREKNPSP